MWDKPFGFYFLLFIILALFFKFYAIIDSFLPAIALGCVLAFLSNPIYENLLKRTKRKTFSAFIVLFFNFAVILVPMTLMFLAVQRQVQFFLGLDTIGYVRNVLQSIDAMLLDKFQIQFFDRYLNDLVKPIMAAGQEGLGLLIPRMIMSMTQFVLTTFITFFLMYYLLLNSRMIINVIRYYGPLNDKNMTILLKEMGRDTKALIFGQLLVAVIQGLLTGLGFMIFNIPGAILWGMVSVITSFLPVLGAGLVWFPACVILLLQGRYFSATGLFLWGAIVVSASDNLIRPKLVSLLGEIHPVTVLLGVFIGIKEWGLIGIVIGPLIISVLIILIRMFREQFLDVE